MHKPHPQLARAYRLVITCAAAVNAFFACWVVCELLLNIDRDVALSLAALVDVIVLVPLGFWSAAEVSGRPHPTARKRATAAVLASIVVGTIFITGTASTLVLKSSTKKAVENAAPILAAPESSYAKASESSPPVLIENIASIRSSAGPMFVTAKTVEMKPDEIGRFETAVYPNSSAFADWYNEHGGSALSSGFINVTIRGNEAEEVRVSDLQIIKSCGKPLRGSFFIGYTQGSGDTIRLGFDLDVPASTAETVANTSGRVRVTGESYFAAHTITLQRGEKETLAVGVFTKTYSCEFTLRLIVATSHGTFYQDVTYNGHPFVVSAMAEPLDPRYPYSGYESVYVNKPSAGQVAPHWARVDPATYIAG